MIIKGHGAPDANQHGSVGDIYLDLDTNNTYECVDVKTDVVDYGFVDIHVPANRYTWNPLSSVEWVDELPEGTAFHASKNSEDFFAPLVKTFNIPRGVTIIGGGCFTSEWSNIEHIHIPDTVTTIEGGAFMGCASLKELTIPGSVQTMGGGMFSGSGIKKLVLEDGITILPIGFTSNATELEELVLPNTLTRIESGAMNTGNKYTTITLPDGLLYIGSGNVFGLVTHLTIPGSVQELGPGAIFNTETLVRLDFQEGITSIPDDIIPGCTALTEVNIPNSVTSIHETAFENGAALSVINIDAEEDSIAGAPWGASETCVVNWLR